MIKRLQDSDNDIIGADTETTALKWYAGSVVGHCFAARIMGKYHGFYVPVRHSVASSNIADVNDIESLLNTAIYDNDKLKKIFFNVKFDMNFLLNHGINLSNYEDAMILMFLRNENERNHQLKHLSSVHIEPGAKDKADHVARYFKQNKLENYGQIPVEILGPYGAKDACLTLALWRKFSAFITVEDSTKQDGITKEIYQHEMRYTALVAKMEREGFPFSEDIAKDLSAPIEKAATKLGCHIFDLLDCDDFNIDSDPELAAALSKAGHKSSVTSWRTGKPSWNRLALMRLDNELGECIAAYRNLTHNLNTFSENLPRWTHRGRIHCSYNQIGARTGRASASEPNMQAIPKRVPKYTRVPDFVNEHIKLAFGIRKAFRAPEGYSILSIDQSQFELRVLDHFAQDRTMHQAFESGRDIHTDTAAQLASVQYEDLRRSLDDDDPDAKFQRVVSKETNFLMVYGGGPKRLKETLDDYGWRLSIDEVKQFYWRYFKIYKEVKRFIDKVQAVIKRRGYIFNCYGRHKRVPANLAYRGVNYIIQGLTADMLKDAMLRVDDHLVDTHTQIMMAVHDEVLYLLHDDEHHLIPIIVKEMEDFPWCRTPIKVDVKIGPSWGELKSWTTSSDQSGTQKSTTSQ